jgi:radical SAM protein with 4Fe4S-binding SPASM domain
MYHLVPSGRGKRYGDISDTQRRELIWSLCDQAKNRDFEILTVDSPADGPLIHQWALENAPELADGILEKLRSQGSDGTGKRIVEIDHNGDVHPNQFWLGKTIGNVVETPFNEIFNPADSGTLDPLLQDLRQEPWSLEGNCATCTYKSLCGGFRARALNMEGSLWASDPTCTLNEIEREALVSV